LEQKNKFSNLAGYTPLKYVISGKPLITPEPRIGKFQTWVKMKISYPTDKKNTPEDFSNNFRNIENFVQVDHSKKMTKNRYIFFYFPLPENRRWPEIFSIHQIQTHIDVRLSCKNFRKIHRPRASEFELKHRRQF
jgi:hypothetical protein